MSTHKIEEIVYDDGRTKQAFKDSTDINKILAKAQRAGSLAHALKYEGAVYGEFTGVDLLGHYEQIERARVIFDDLPSAVRKDFGNDAFKFAAFASDPENTARLVELLPTIAEPGPFFKPPIVPVDEPVTPVIQVAPVPVADPAVVPPVVPPAV